MPMHLIWEEEEFERQGKIATGQAPGATVPRQGEERLASEGAAPSTPPTKSTMEKVQGFLQSAAGKGLIHGLAAFSDAVGQHLTLRGQQGVKGTAMENLLALEKGQRETQTEQRKQTTEQDKLKIEQEKLELERTRETRLARTNRTEAYSKAVKAASDLAYEANLKPSPLVDQAKQQFFDSLEDPVTKASVQMIFANRDYGQRVGPLLPYIPLDQAATMYAFMDQIYNKTGDVEKAYAHAQLIAAPQIRNALTDRAKRVREAVRATGFQGTIPVEALQSALDPREDDPLIRALQGEGFFAHQGMKDNINNMLTTYGFATLGGAAKVSETKGTARATEEVKKEFEKPIKDESVRIALLAKGIDPEQATAKEIKDVNDRLQARKGNVAEYISYLRRKGGSADDKEEADRLVGIEKELREASAVKMPPQLPAGEVAKLADLGGFVEMLDTLKKLHKSEYTGAYQGRVGAMQAKTTGLSKEETRFRTITQSLLNQLGLLRSGAAITETEYERLVGEVPTMTDPDRDFLAKTDTVRDLLSGILRRRKEAFATFGFKGESGGFSTLSDEALKKQAEKLGIKTK